jgi:membrane-bound lytic murein transglycosylase A
LRPPATVIWSLCVLAAAMPADAQSLSEGECTRLLVDDEGQAPLREAAARNLAALAVRAPDAQAVRRASEALIEALPSTDYAERLCASLVMRRAAPAALLTGYYRPLVPASRTREGEFRHPLYALPPADLRGLPRAAIERGALNGTVPVVAWLDDPIEAFFIHIQGSALLALPDGGRMAVGYAGSNGRSYTSIGALLVRDGRMRREDVTMESLKRYLRDHPSERDAILHANERYIYFQAVDEHAAGSLGVPLTGGRSVAADPAVYPPGSLLFITPPANSPGGTGSITPRLVFVQDRGSAITGPGRLDLYVGTGEAAGSIAGPLQQEVDVFVLTPR